MRAIFVAVVAMAALAGCASTSNSGSVYGTGEAGREQTVRMGVVESIRQVTIEPQRSGVGAVAGGAVGAVLGGAAGNHAGRGVGGAILGVLGAVGGGLAGDAIERSGNRKPGLEITVKLDNGELRAITQEADETFKPGERVRLLSSGGTTKVTH